MNPQTDRTPPAQPDRPENGPRKPIAAFWAPEQYQKSLDAPKPREIENASRFRHGGAHGAHCGASEAAGAGVHGIVDGLSEAIAAVSGAQECHSTAPPPKARQIESAGRCRQKRQLQPRRRGIEGTLASRPKCNRLRCNPQTPSLAFPPPTR
jgi:hypothetical protein